MFGELWTQQAGKWQCCQKKKAVNCKVTLPNSIQVLQVKLVLADNPPFIYCDDLLPQSECSYVLHTVCL